MEVIKNNITPNDNPAMPANLPPEGELAQGFWGSQNHSPSLV